MNKRIRTRRWIPAVYPPGTNSANAGSRDNMAEPGTGCWSKDFPRRGEFLGWGIEYEEVGDGLSGRHPAHYSVALVQFPGEGVKTLHPDHVQFDTLNLAQRLVVKLIAMAILIGTLLIAWWLLDKFFLKH